MVVAVETLPERVEVVAPAVSVSTGAPASRSSPLHHRLTHIDGVRALCALGVVVHHVVLTVFLTSVNPRPMHGFLARLEGLLRYGEERVIAFSVLSGFCLMIPVAKGDGRIRGGISLFLRRRARRLLPPYFIVLALSVVVGLTVFSGPTISLWHASQPLEWRDVLLHALLIHNVDDHSHKINYVLWSIAIEWQLYFVFPFFVLMTRRAGIVTAVVAANVVGLTLQGILASRGAESVHADYLAFFSLGAWASWISFRQRGEPGVAWTAVTVLAAAMVVFFIMGTDHPAWSHPVAAIAIAAALCCLGLWPRGMAARVLSVKPLAAIGACSYSLYLLHPFVIEACQRYLVRPNAGLTANQELLLLVPLSMVLSLAVAAGFFYVVERPFMSVPLIPQPGRIDALLRDARKSSPDGEIQAIGEAGGTGLGGG